MKISRLAAVCAAFAVAAPSLRAQGGSIAMRQWSLALAAGAVQGARRDETVSPLRFTGAGSAGSIEVARVSDRGRLQFELSGNTAKLVSDATTSNEQLSNGTFSVDAVRSLGIFHNIRVDAGFDARLSYDDTFHRFFLTDVASTTYRLAMVTAGPALVVEDAAPWGVLQFRAAVPVIGVVDHPYSDVKNGYASFHPVFVSVNRLRQADAAVFYTSANSQRVHLRVSARTNVLYFRDQQSVHAITNSLSAGLVLQQRSRTR